MEVKKSPGRDRKREEHTTRLRLVSIQMTDEQIVGESPGDSWRGSKNRKEKEKDRYRCVTEKVQVPCTVCDFTPQNIWINV